MSFLCGAKFFFFYRWLISPSLHFICSRGQSSCRWSSKRTQMTEWMNGKLLFILSIMAKHWPMYMVIVSPLHRFVLIVTNTNFVSRCQWPKRQNVKRATREFTSGKIYCKNVEEKHILCHRRSCSDVKVSVCRSLLFFYYFWKLLFRSFAWPNYWLASWFELSELKTATSWCSWCYYLSCYVHSRTSRRQKLVDCVLLKRFREW